MSDAPRTDAVARALGAAAMCWKGREIDAVTFCEQAESALDDMRKMEGELNEAYRRLKLIKSAAEASVDRAHTQGIMDSILRQEIGKLKDEVAELIKDRERLDWLVNKIAYQPAADGMRWATLNWCVEVDSLSPASIHDAIDAAMEAKS